MVGHFLSKCLALVAIIGQIQANSRHYIPESDQYYYDAGYMSDFTESEWSVMGGRLNQPKCIDIPSNLTLCADIGYTKMRLPNLLDHDTLQEVTSQANSWVPLARLGCHADTKLFLCSLFSPVCLDRMDRSIPPCRTLCEAVKDGCLVRMNKYGFGWPEMLQCDQFPLDDDLCIGIQTDTKPNDTICSVCHNPPTFEAILDSACNSEFVMRFSVDEINVDGDDKTLSLHNKKKVFKKGSLRRRDLTDTVVRIEDGAHCECSALNSLPSDARRTQFIGMGNRSEDGLALTFIKRFDKNDPDMKKALREIRKDRICQEGIRALTEDQATEADTPVATTSRPGRRTSSRGNRRRSRGRGGRGRRRDSAEVVEVEEVDMLTPVVPVESAENPSSGGNRDQSAESRESRDSRERRPGRNGRQRKRGRRRRTTTTAPTF